MNECDYNDTLRNYDDMYGDAEPETHRFDVLNIGGALDDFDVTAYTDELAAWLSKNGLTAEWSEGREGDRLVVTMTTKHDGETIEFLAAHVLCCGSWVSTADAARVSEIAKALAETGSVKAAAARLGMSRSQVYERRKR